MERGSVVFAEKNQSIILKFLSFICCEYVRDQWINRTFP